MIMERKPLDRAECVPFAVTPLVIVASRDDVAPRRLKPPRSLRSTGARGAPGRGVRAEHLVGVESAALQGQP